MAFLRRNRNRLLTCFYCGEQSGRAPATARIEAWTCPLCEALNVLDGDGNIADTIPEKYQRKSVAVSAQRPSQAPDLQSPFCAVCSSNQALLTKTLASYLPDEEDRDYALYERALPAYKASLEERFPPFCASCAPALQARLERNNYVAKSLALGGWLNGKTDRRIRVSLVQQSIWFMRGCLFWTINAAMLIWFFSEGLAWPISNPFSWPVTLASLCFGSVWNPLGLAQRQGRGCKVIGKADYLLLQCFMLATRLAALVVLPSLSSTTPIRQRLGILGVTVSLLHAWLSPRLMRLDAPVQAKLTDRTTKLKDMLPPEADSGNARQVQESPFHVPLPKAGDEQRPAQLDDYEDAYDEDSMDWQPSPPASRASPFAASFRPAAAASTVFGASAFTQRLPAIRPAEGRSQPAMLAPQRLFAPEQPTGLESLFHAAVRLEDEPLLVKSLRQVQRSPLPVIKIGCSAAALAGSACLFYEWYRTCLFLYVVSGVGLLYLSLYGRPVARSKKTGMRQPQF